MKKKICMVTGVGEGNGHSITKRFTKEGYRVAMLARSAERLNKYEQEFEGSKGFVCDVNDADSVKSSISKVHDQLGLIDVFIHNAGSGMFADFLSTTPEQMESAWRTNTMGLFLLGQAAAKDMLESGVGGSIVVVGATSSLRGGANFTPFASAKASQRSLAQSMARGLGPKGIHVSYVIVDGLIDIPRIRKMDWAKNKPDDAFLIPDEIADAIWFLSKQPKSAWTFELDLRPYRESW